MSQDVDAGKTKGARRGEPGRLKAGAVRQNALAKAPPLEAVFGKSVDV